MTKISQKLLYLLAALAALFYTNAEAEERLTCPSLEKAAEMVDRQVFKAADKKWFVS
jgi:hypothetical protein